MRRVPNRPSITVPSAWVVPPATPVRAPPAVSSPTRMPVTLSCVLGRSVRSTSRSTPLPPGWSMVPGRLGKRMTLPVGLLSWALPLVEAAWAAAWSSLATGLSLAPWMRMRSWAMSLSPPRSVTW
ncbi:hypothetical protein D3C76_666320 [compost metagenome]